MGKLDKKVALITGGARGIGRAIAKGFAREGAAIVLADIDTNNLARTEAEVIGLGSDVLAVVTDVADEQQVKSLFEKTLGRFKRLDILVNNAGIFDSSPVDELSAGTWDRVIGVNLRGPFLCTREAFKIMKPSGGGRIINIGSISAQRVRPGNAAYSATKFGLVGLTHTTALEGRKFGINCGCLHPGNTRHDYQSGTDWEKEPMMTQEETAAAAVYMACLPPHINVLELVQMPTEQLYVGRG